MNSLTDYLKEFSIRNNASYFLFNQSWLFHSSPFCAFAFSFAYYRNAMMSLQNTLFLEWMILISKPNGLEYIIANKEKLGLICIILSPLKEDFSFDQTGKFSCPEIKVFTAFNKSLNISCFPNEFLYLKSTRKYWLEYWA